MKLIYLVGTIAQANEIWMENVKFIGNFGYIISGLYLDNSANLRMLNCLIS